jgi:hypothetical protein
LLYVFYICPKASAYCLQADLHTKPIIEKLARTHFLFLYVCVCVHLVRGCSMLIAHTAPNQKPEK